MIWWWKFCGLKSSTMIHLEQIVGHWTFMVLLFTSSISDDTCEVIPIWNFDLHIPIISTNAAVCKKSMMRQSNSSSGQYRCLFQLANRWCDEFQYLYVVFIIVCSYVEIGLLWKSSSLMIVCRFTSLKTAMISIVQVRYIMPHSSVVGRFAEPKWSVQMFVIQQNLDIHRRCIMQARHCES